MPHIAYYDVLTDDVVLSLPQFEAKPPESINQQIVKFDPANDIELDATGKSRPLLCYQVDLENADDFKLRVQVRDKQGADRTVSNWTFDGNATRQFMDPFHLEWLQTGVNQIFFKKISGNGGVKIRNVVVFYQRDI